MRAVAGNVFAVGREKRAQCIVVFGVECFGEPCRGDEAVSAPRRKAAIASDGRRVLLMTPGYGAGKACVRSLLAIALSASDSVPLALTSFR